MKAEAAVLHFFDRRFPGPVIEDDMIHRGDQSRPVGSCQAMNEDGALPVFHDPQRVYYAGFVDTAGFQGYLMEDERSARSASYAVLVFIPAKIEDLTDAGFVERS